VVVAHGERRSGGEPGARGGAEVHAVGRDDPIVEVGEGGALGVAPRVIETFDVGGDDGVDRRRE
jgi:hypothetical protein